MQMFRPSAEVWQEKNEKLIKIQDTVQLSRLRHANSEFLLCWSPSIPTHLTAKASVQRTGAVWALLRVYPGEMPPPVLHLQDSFLHHSWTLLTRVCVAVTLGTLHWIIWSPTQISTSWLNSREEDGVCGSFVISSSSSSRPRGYSFLF